VHVELNTPPLILPDTILYLSPESPTVADAVDESSIKEITTELLGAYIKLPVAFVANDADINCKGNSKLPASKRSFKRFLLNL
jgi:hypothetical protein